MFEEIIGNEKVKGYLTRLFQSEKMASLYLFSGPSGIGKSLFAQELSKRSVGTTENFHPDVHSYQPEGKLGMHSIETVRSLKEELIQSPRIAKRGAFIIHEAHRMLPTSANALLKAFEEPHPAHTIFLISSEPEILLPTLLSRSFRVNFQPVQEQELIPWLQQRYQKSSEEVKLIATLAQGSVGKAVKLSEKNEYLMRTLLLQVLSKGSFRTYHDLRQEISYFAQIIEEKREAKENEKTPEEEMSAIQRQHWAKEREGVGALGFLREVDDLLALILGWYRDLHLLYVRGDPRFLIHPDQKENLDQALQRGNLFPLEKVQQWIQETRLAIARSSSLSTSLEILFLKLNFL